MQSLETLLGDYPTTPIANEIIRRVYNPADVLVGDQLTGYICNVHGVGLSSAGGEVIDPEEITPELFNRIVVPGLIRAGYDAGFVVFTGSGIRSINKERDPQYCPANALPEQTIAQINASHEMVFRLGEIVVEQIPEDAENAQKWVQAGHIMAKMGYGDKVRATKRPYISHPQDVAALSNHIIDRINRNGHRVSGETRALLAAVALIHDVLEEWRKSASYYVVGDGQEGSRDVLTPLAIKTVYEKLGMRETLASYLANAVRLMTHDKDGPWMLDFGQYLYRGSGNRLVVPTKATDMFHNLTLEPKPQPTRRKGERKDRFIERVLEWDRHRGEYFYYVYEGGYAEVPYEKNALHADQSLRKWGGKYLSILAGLAYPDNLPNRAAVGSVKRDDRKSGSAYYEEDMPQLRDSLSNRYGIELVSS